MNSDVGSRFAASKVGLRWGPAAGMSVDQSCCIMCHHVVQDCERQRDGQFVPDSVREG